jgi:hypothetical protein
MPQLVMQIDKVDRSGFFLQLLIQMVSSPLHRMGAARAAAGKSKAMPMRPANLLTILCCVGPGKGESRHRCMATF